MVTLFVRSVFDRPQQAFTTVLACALLVTVVLLIVDGVAVCCGRGAVQRGQARARWNLLGWLLYAATAASIAVLAVTAFYSVLARGAMHGWFLFVHMLGAGALVALLPLLALTWTLSQWSSSRRRTGQPSDDTGRFPWRVRALFWLVVFAGLTTISSMLAGMFPYFGTEALHDLVTVHRYSGLVLVVAMTVHFYWLVLAVLPSRGHQWTTEGRRKSSSRA